VFPQFRKVLRVDGQTHDINYMAVVPRGRIEPEKLTGWGVTEDEHHHRRGCGTAAGAKGSQLQLSNTYNQHTSKSTSTFSKNENMFGCIQGKFEQL
jgi:hypothetical protein